MRILTCLFSSRTTLSTALLSDLQDFQGGPFRGHPCIYGPPKHRFGFALCLAWVECPPKMDEIQRKTGPDRRSAGRRRVTPPRERGTFVRSRSGLNGGNRPAKSAPPLSFQLECLPSPALKYSAMIPMSLAAARSPAGKATMGAAAELPASPLSGRRTPALGHSSLASSPSAPRGLLIPAATRPSLVPGNPRYLPSRSYYRLTSASRSP
jgi:hypothetical protein